MKAWYIMDYRNGNKGIVEEAEARRREREFILSGEGNLSVEDIENCKTELEAAGASFDEWLENEIDKNIGGYIVGVIYADKEPAWDDLEYDAEAQEYHLKAE